MLIRVYLEYYHEFWSPQNKRNIDNLDRVQKRTNKAGAYDIQGKAEVNGFVYLREDWEGDLIANPTKQSGIKEET